MSMNPAWLKDQILEMKKEIEDIKAILVAISKSETKEKKK